MGNYFCCRRGGIPPLGEDERNLLPEKDESRMGASRNATISITASLSTQPTIATATTTASMTNTATAATISSETIEGGGRGGFGGVGDYSSGRNVGGKGSGSGSGSNSRTNRYGSVERMEEEMIYGQASYESLRSPKDRKHNNRTKEFEQKMHKANNSTHLHNNSSDPSEEEEEQHQSSDGHSSEEEEDLRVPNPYAPNNRKTSISMNNNNNNNNNDKELQKINNNHSGQLNGQISYPDYVDSKTEAIEVSECGHSSCNGEYRWFFHDKRWVKLDEDGAFAIASNIPMSEIYDQLQQIQGENTMFRWKSDVTHGWVICDMARQQIYYAVPMRNPGQIPTSQWIPVYGKKPGPKLSVGTHQSEFHDTTIIPINNSINNHSSSRRSKDNIGRSNLSEQVILENQEVQEEEEEEEHHYSQNEDSDKEQLEKEENISDLES